VGDCTSRSDQLTILDLLARVNTCHIKDLQKDREIVILGRKALNFFCNFDSPNLSASSLISFFFITVVRAGG